MPVYTSKSCVGIYLGKVPGNYISTLGQIKPVGPTFIVSFFRQMGRKNSIILQSSWTDRAHSFIREEHGILHQPRNAGWISCSCNGCVNVRESFSRLDWGAFLSFVLFYFSSPKIEDCWKDADSQIKANSLWRSAHSASIAELRADAENHSHGGFLAALWDLRLDFPSFPTHLSATQTHST